MGLAAECRDSGQPRLRNVEEEVFDDDCPNMNEDEEELDGSIADEGRLPTAGVRDDE